MSKTTILYKDIAPGAIEDAAVSTNGAQPFSRVDQLPYGGDEAPIASCEWNNWGLNGRFFIVDTQKVAFWSSTISDSSGVFKSPPVITLDFDLQYSSLGLTLQFDTGGGDYCRSVNIKWYQGSTLKADADYSPNAPSYFCQKKVESYNKIVVTLNNTSLPYRYAKLEKIIFGVFRNFDMSEIRSASLVNEMSILASEIPISTMKWVLDSDDDLEFMFQLKQPVEVSNDNHLIGVYYIDGYSRTSGRLYNVECYDAFGVLDESLFDGGVYSNYSAQKLLREIVGTDFELVFELPDTTLTGVIQSGTKRQAMQQVLFAWGACASTDGRESIRVFSPGDTPKRVGAEQTFTGVSVSTSAIVTAVRVTAHTYAQSANGNVTINGVKYDDTETVYTVTNPNVTASDKQNIVEVKDATLVSPSIGQATAQRVYDFYSRRNTSNARIVWKEERLGDCITHPNAWGGTNTGNIEKMEIKLSNTVVASCETIGV